MGWFNCSFELCVHCYRYGHTASLQPYLWLNEGDSAVAGYCGTVIACLHAKKEWIGGQAWKEVMALHLCCTSQQANCCWICALDFAGSPTNV
jgi:hypothetical protein